MNTPLHPSGLPVPAAVSPTDPNYLDAASDLGNPDNVIEVSGLRTQFGPKVIHDELAFSAKRGEVMGLVGGSGTGKSVLLRTMIGLMRPRKGHIQIMGREMLGVELAGDLLDNIGVLFQDGALFSSLTVLENIEVPLKAHRNLSPALRREVANVKLSLAGLPPDAGPKLPSEISGGMRKRAGIARALALDPDVLFLDEPTAGLDPISAGAFDELVLDLQQALGLTVVLVTHDLDTLFTSCDRVSVLLDKRVKVGKLSQLRQDPHPWMQDYFNGPRGRSAEKALDDAEAQGLAVTGRKEQGSDAKPDGQDTRKNGEDS
ncbi:ABC transporter ATP-binding protein [Rhodovibrionaceae bacterium A322]